MIQKKKRLLIRDQEMADDPDTDDPQEMAEDDVKSGATDVEALKHTLLLQEQLHQLRALTELRRKMYSL